MIRRSLLASSLAAFAVAAGCKDAPPPSHAPHAPEEAAATNRVEIPPAVRSNLGMTFAKVETRVVAATTRHPGRFEAAPGTRLEYRAPVVGRVVWRSKPLAAVRKGDEIYRLDAPRLRELSRELVAIEAALGEAQASLAGLPAYRAAHAEHEKALKAAVELWNKRLSELTALSQAGVGRADELATARAQSAAAAAALAETLEKDADLDARESELNAIVVGAEARAASVRAERAALSNGFDGSSDAGVDVNLVVVRALRDGIVESFATTDGGFATEGALVATTIDLSSLRVRALAPQADLPFLAGNVSARITAPSGDPARATIPPLPATLAIDVLADPATRTITIFATPTEAPPPWARPGVVVSLEIAPSNAAAELSIPKAAILRDGLKHVFFRRDPSNPDRAIRLEADLGADDGRFVAIRSGVRDGDEVVLAGAYQLMLASSGSAQRGGHYHADGTFHADEK
jgi:hypothetical protein